MNKARLTHVLVFNGKAKMQIQQLGQRLMSRKEGLASKKISKLNS